MGKSAKTRTASRRASATRTSATRASAKSLMVRLDARSKSFVTRAAALRGISVSDYVRTVTVGHAQREVQVARDRTIRLSPEDQLAFWNALHEAPILTPAQRELGAIARGERKAFDDSLDASGEL